MVFSLTVPFFFIALADPILEAAAQQQDKEHVIEYFAAARARELSKLNKAREGDLASFTASKKELYSKLKIASDNYWHEHATRTETQEALFKLEKQRAKEVDTLTTENTRDKASLKEAESEVSTLTDKLKRDDSALETSRKEGSALKTEVAHLQEEATASANAKAEEHAKDTADIKRLEELNAKLRSEAEKDSAAAATNLAAARSEGSRANAEATRARAALSRDKELLQQVKTDAEKKIAELETQWKKEEAAAEQQWSAQQKELEEKMAKEREETTAHLQKEEAALKDLQTDRVELQKVAEAAVAKVEVLEAQAKDVDAKRSSEAAQATADAESLRAEVAEMKANLTQRAAEKASLQAEEASLQSKNHKLSAALESAEAEVARQHSGVKEPHPPKAAPLVAAKEPTPVEKSVKEPKPHELHHKGHHKRGHANKIHMKFLHT